MFAQWLVIGREEGSGLPGWHREQEIGQENKKYFLIHLRDRVILTVYKTVISDNHMYVTNVTRFMSFLVLKIFVEFVSYCRVQESGTTDNRCSY